MKKRTKRIIEDVSTLVFVLSINAVVWGFLSLFAGFNLIEFLELIGYPQPINLSCGALLASSFLLFIFIIGVAKFKERSKRDKNDVFFISINNIIMFTLYFAFTLMFSVSMGALFTSNTIWMGLLPLISYILGGSCFLLFFLIFIIIYAIKPVRMDRKKGK